MKKKQKKSKISKQSKPRKYGSGRKEGEKGKPEVFEIYTRWKCLPGIFKRYEDKVLDAMGIDDPETRMLLEIKTQEDFMKKYGVVSSTLADWNGEIGESESYKARKAMAKKLMSSALGFLYAGMAKEKDAARFKEIARYAEEYEPEKHVITGEIDFGRLNDLSNEELKRIIDRAGRGGQRPKVVG